MIKTVGQKVRFWAVWRPCCWFFMVWDVSNATGTGGTGHLKNDPFRVLSWPWFWARDLDRMISQKCLPTPAVLCFCGSNFSVCPLSCFTSLHLVISHSTGINTLFPGTGSSAGSGWSSPPTWRSVRCLTVFTLPVTKHLFGKHKNFLLLQYFYPGAGWKSPERPSLTKATCGESPCL